MRILRFDWLLLLALSTAPAFGNPPPVGQPVVGQPVVGQPVVGQPVVGQPPVVGQSPAGPPDDSVLFASPTRKDRIGRILAPVMINGRGPFRMVVDTGASYSTVSPQLVATLGLESSDDYPFVVNGVTGSIRAPSVPIDVLQAGDLELRSLRLPVIWAPIMGGADGILGAAGFRNERIMVEFARNRVTISRPHLGMAPRGFKRIRANLMENGLMTVDVTVGGVRAIAIIDTGAERSLGNQALREALRHWQNSRKAPNFTDVFGTSSDVARGERGLAPIISFGPLNLIDVDIIYGDFHIFDVWNLRDRPAMILGMDVLGTVRSLGIDFRNRELYFEGAYLGVG